MKGRGGAVSVGFKDGRTDIHQVNHRPHGIAVCVFVCASVALSPGQIIAAATVRWRN